MAITITHKMRCNKWLPWKRSIGQKEIWSFYMIFQANLFRCFGLEIVPKQSLTSTKCIHVTFLIYIKQISLLIFNVLYLHITFFFNDKKIILLFGIVFVTDWRCFLWILKNIFFTKTKQFYPCVGSYGFTEGNGHRLFSKSGDTDCGFAEGPKFTSS